MGRGTHGGPAFRYNGVSGRRRDSGRTAGRVQELAVVAEPSWTVSVFGREEKFKNFGQDSGGRDQNLQKTEGVEIELWLTKALRIVSVKNEIC